MGMPAATYLELLAIIFLIDYRKKDESQESHFKDAVGVCLPLINATVRDIEKGMFPKDCSLNIEIPTSPSSNKVCISNKLVSETFFFCSTFVCKDHANQILERISVAAIMQSFFSESLYSLMLGNLTSLGNDLGKLTFLVHMNRVSR